jgi:phosphoglycolate phosphatase-like HAD superfamily hydrolase
MQNKDYQGEFKAFSREKEFFIGFDSDGCVFDTMELKHKECFCPALIQALECQPVSRVAREVWEFVNLYSKMRGCNRFLAVSCFRNLLRERKEVEAAGFKVPELQGLDEWIAAESRLGNATLEKAVNESGSEALARVLAWSKDVNARVKHMVHGMTPFPGVVEVLERAGKAADMMVVSQTPLEALNREWEENQILHHVSLVAGQEHGTKAEHIQMAIEGNDFPPGRVLMVGDAPGDHEAASVNNALFFPIVPGRESESWKALRDEGLERFFTGSFAGAYQHRLLDEFDAALPETPPWHH